MAFWNRRRSIDAMLAPHDGLALKKTLGWPHLMLLGIGAIVGTGIYTLTGVGVEKAGPGIIVAFAIVGLVCACVALAYAELATLMPAAGGAYTYSYAALGEALAWIIGWSLILEYSLVVSAVAVGWSEYAVGFLRTIDVGFPQALAAGPHADGVVNVPAIAIIAVVTGLLLLGTKESATVNAILVVVKCTALAVFIAVVAPAFDPANFQPLMPFGFNKNVGPSGVEVGVMAGAAIVFFAFYGFDAVATAAEETKNPARDLTIGILGSMAICTVLYMLVAAVAVGSMPFARFSASGEPLALILRLLNQPLAAQIVAGAVIVGVPTVILAFFYGQTRIFYVMARDGLLPRGLGVVSARGVPVVVTLFTAVIVATLAGLLPLDEIAALANAGTLAAFTAVCASLLVLRLREPRRERIFRSPLAWVVGPLGIAGCLYLLSSLPTKTQLWFLAWNVLGLVIYLLWSSRHSRLAKGEEVEG
ncbi:amino acid permease [Brevundimonas sp. FT23042]|uniref:amino acid permease n=1 Tax=Brevundimonas sp. FT23042 TaxID=3393749 RepID=UPI003B5861D0